MSTLLTLSLFSDSTTLLEEWWSIIWNLQLGDMLK